MGGQARQVSPDAYALFEAILQSWIWLFYSTALLPHKQGKVYSIGPKKEICDLQAVTVRVNAADLENKDVNPQLEVSYRVIQEHECSRVQTTKLAFFGLVHSPNLTGKRFLPTRRALESTAAPLKWTIGTLSLTVQHILAHWDPKNALKRGPHKSKSPLLSQKKASYPLAVPIASISYDCVSISHCELYQKGFCKEW